MNKVTLLGRLTKDVEVRYTNSNMAIAAFTLAVPRQYKKEGEDRQCDFITCKAFSKSAEFIQKYFSKGSMLGIVGRIQTGSYDKDDGTRVYTTDVIVEETHFAGSKNEQRGDAAESSGQQGGFFPGDNGEDELPF